MTATMESSGERLNVAIIGGGISGMMAARVLREKHEVTIYERSRAPTEVGAAINVGPNGVKILESLGFDRERVGSLAVTDTKSFGIDGKLLMHQTRKYAQDYGADWLFQHRADLRNELLRLATEKSSLLGIEGEPATIQWGAEVQSIDVEKGLLTFSNGDEILSDLIIGADGIKSFVRPEIVGDVAFTSARPSGLSAFRFTLQAPDVLSALGELPEVLMKDKPVTLTMVLDFGSTHRSIVVYPCRGFDLLNFVCIVPDSSLKTAATESWTAEGDREEMLSLFHDFPDWALKLLELSNAIKLWQLRDQDPLPSYVKGRTVIVGDAAHAMTPHQGQGGTQAIEDGEAFRLFLEPGCTRNEVPQILRKLDSVRRPRAAQIQNNTRKAAHKRTAEDMFRFEVFNFTYPGIIEALRQG